jgi:hypothetical protein
MLSDAEAPALIACQELSPLRNVELPAVPVADNIAISTASVAIVVALPELVTSPVKFALVVIAIFPVPSKEVPPIVLAVANAVAVAARPEQVAELPLAFPVTLPVIGPANPVDVKTPVPAL